MDEAVETFNLVVPLLDGMVDTISQSQNAIELNDDMINSSDTTLNDNEKNNNYVNKVRTMYKNSTVLFNSIFSFYEKQYQGRNNASDLIKLEFVNIENYFTEAKKMSESVQILLEYLMHFNEKYNDKYIYKCVRYFFKFHYILTKYQKLFHDTNNINDNDEELKYELRYKKLFSALKSSYCYFLYLCYNAIKKIKDSSFEISQEILDIIQDCLVVQKEEDLILYETEIENNRKSAKIYLNKNNKDYQEYINEANKVIKEIKDKVKEYGKKGWAKAWLMIKDFGIEAFWFAVRHYRFVLFFIKLIWGWKWHEDVLITVLYNFSQAACHFVAEPIIFWKIIGYVSQKIIKISYHTGKFFGNPFSYLSSNIANFVGATVKDFIGCVLPTMTYGGGMLMSYVIKDYILQMCETIGNLPGRLINLYNNNVERIQNISIPTREEIREEFRNVRHELTESILDKIWDSTVSSYESVKEGIFNTVFNNNISKYILKTMFPHTYPVTDMTENTINEMERLITPNPDSTIGYIYLNHLDPNRFSEWNVEPSRYTTQKTLLQAIYYDFMKMFSLISKQATKLYEYSGSPIKSIKNLLLDYFKTIITKFGYSMNNIIKLINYLYHKISFYFGISIWGAKMFSRLRNLYNKDKSDDFRPIDVNSIRRMVQSISNYRGEALNTRKRTFEETKEEKDENERNENEIETEASKEVEDYRKNGKRRRLKAKVLK
jgi:hypothetical protein